jgi:hypothetical protein
VPAVIIGSLLSSKSEGYLLRRVITGVVLLSGLKYVGVGTTALGIIAGLIIVLITFLTIRHWRHGQRIVVKADLVAEPVQGVVALLPTWLDGDL